MIEKILENDIEIQITMFVDTQDIKVMVVLIIDKVVSILIEEN